MFHLVQFLLKTKIVKSVDTIQCTLILGENVIALFLFVKLVKLCFCSRLYCRLQRHATNFGSGSATSGLKQKLDYVPQMPYYIVIFYVQSMYCIVYTVHCEVCRYCLYFLQFLITVSQGLIHFDAKTLDIKNCFENFFGQTTESPRSHNFREYLYATLSLSLLSFLLNFSLAYFWKTLKVSHRL